MKILLVPNRDKPDAVAAAERLRELLSSRASVTVMSDPGPAQLREHGPDLIVVLGGDGSILSIAQEMQGIHTPVVGINFGKLGYLAAFSLEQFLTHLEVVLTGKAPVTHRLVLEGSIYRMPAEYRSGAGGLGGHQASGKQVLEMLAKEKPVQSAVALNDVVINAGHPYRMIELEVQVDGHKTTTFRSDGVVLATASGSTGYNLSAGGPLVTPEVEAMVMTPICPHSLSFRPVVLPSNSQVLVCPHKLNEGSKVNFDGQVIHAFTERDCLLIRRAADTLTLVENPDITHWQMLAQKLHWAQSPRQ